MNKTISALAIVAVLAAAALIASTMVTNQAFAHKRHHSGGSCNGGSTCTSQTNIGRATASGSGTTAANIQLNLNDVSL